MRSELESVRQTIRKGLNCTKTFGITAATVLPVACPGTITLKRTNGANLAPGGKIGDWNINLSCTGSDIKIGISKPGTDPLTGKAWSALTDKLNNLVSVDAFGGTSSFCSEYLSTAGPTACTSPEVVINIDFDSRTVQCGPGPFGGNYQFYLGDAAIYGTSPGTTTCRHANPFTGTCSCPPGYSANFMSEFHSGFDPAINACPHYSDGFIGDHEKCGYLAFICVKI
jgi:hypothetical protein